MSGSFPLQWRKCPYCEGRGGGWTAKPAALRRARRASGLSLREMGKRIGLSAMYLCDVERGRRNATERIVQAYERLAGARP